MEEEVEKWMWDVIHEGHKRGLSFFSIMGVLFSVMESLMVKVIAEVQIK